MLFLTHSETPKDRNVLCEPQHRLEDREIQAESRGDPVIIKHLSPLSEKVSRIQVGLQDSITQ